MATRSRNPTTIRYCRCSTPRDRELQIAWGIEDFVYRFGHRPDGMWLPECAVDDATLLSLAEAGLKFTILANDQGSFGGEAREQSQRRSLHMAAR